MESFLVITFLCYSVLFFVESQICYNIQRYSQHHCQNFSQKYVLHHSPKEVSWRNRNLKAAALFRTLPGIS